MAERRPLVDGLKDGGELERIAEQELLNRLQANSRNAPRSSAPDAGIALVPNRRAATRLPSLPFTTRLRSDIHAAIKRASLERQLDALEPHTVKEILEELLEPWLVANGYLVPPQQP